MIKSLIISLSLFFVSNSLFAMTNQEFINWWSNFRNSPTLPIELKKMEDAFISKGLIIYSSNFWNDFNKLNIEQLTGFGFDNFKQTVAANYFTWKVDIDHLYAQNLKRLVPELKVIFSEQELKRKHSLWTPQESKNFNIITMYYTAPA